MLRRLAALTGVVLATVLLGASQSVAGGPTSVLVVSPESGQADALYHTAARYRELEKYLGSEEVDGVRGRPLDIDGAVGEGGTWRRLTVTWLRHDVSVWRVDRVHLPRSAGPIWVSTRTDGSAAPAERWHLADDPAKLRRLLSALGVLGDRKGGGAASESGPGGGSDYPPDLVSSYGAAPAGSDAGTPVPAGGGDNPGSADWWWPIPGLAAGTVVGFAGITLIRRGTARQNAGPRDPGPPGPRRQLIDT
ncbi:hypothetical protein [Streptomyces agglomeratus]|uniref:hypothetical protein n=1 Tax=Streptomyces agglomeratus TaxID=285458 RepID=UPI00114CC551|nr:hypothetical protein [Streptomyces agglomeratus]